MKLHNISKVLGVGIAALLLTACKDGNDWSVDSSKARVFSVSSTDISIDREMTQATVTFKPTKGVENYTLEVSPSIITRCRPTRTSTNIWYRKSGVWRSTRLPRWF